MKQNNGMMPSFCAARKPLLETSENDNQYIRMPGPYCRDYYIRFEDDFHRFCGFTEEETSKKILMVGGSGYGKTNAFYQTFQEMNRAASCVVNLVFDTKGDYLKRFGTEDRSETVVISHRRDHLCCVTWNVFSEILATNEDYRVSCREMAKILLGKKLFQEDRQKFFVDAAVEVLTTAMLVLLNECYIYAQVPSNRDLVDFLTLSPEEILEKSKEFGLRETLDKLISPAQNGEYSGQTLGVFGEVRNIVNDLFVGSFTGVGTYSIREEIQNCRGKKNIFIEYDVNLGKTLSPIYTCIVTNAIKETLGRKQQPCKVNLLIDEWALLEKIPDMETAISFGREPGLFILAAFQHIGQMREIYGNNTTDGMLNGFHNLIAFNTKDKETRDYIRHRAGLILKKQAYYASLSARSVCCAEEPIIRDEDITSLSIGEALIVPGTQNIITRFKFHNVKD